MSALLFCSLMFFSHVTFAGTNKTATAPAAAVVEEVKPAVEGMAADKGTMVPKECGEEMTKVCPNMEGNDQEMTCMKTHMKSFKKACRTAIKKANKATQAKM